MPGVDVDDVGTGALGHEQLLGGALAQATSDFVPYALLAASLLGTLATAQRLARA